MRSKEYRDSFVAAHLSSTVAAQIFSMREDRGWTQSDLAAKSDMKQSRISALEDPDYENIEVGTLRRLASAFDVGLIVRFVPFSELASWSTSMSSGKFSVASFDKDELPNWGISFVAGTSPSKGRSFPVVLQGFIGKILTSQGTTAPSVTKEVTDEDKSFEFVLPLLVGAPVPTGAPTFNFPKGAEWQPRILDRQF